jgi:chemotaxis protein methyltransferase CheR
MQGFSAPPGEMTDADFKKISTLVYELCGIHLHEGKKELVKARLGKRVRAGRFSSFREYYQYAVEDPSGEELTHLLDSIATNFTSFFREPQHFDYLQKEFMPGLAAGGSKGCQKKLRFWSAGCSSGEEPYSLLICLYETLPDFPSWDIQILATDLSQKILKTAMTGVYPQERIASVPVPVKKKYFLQGENQWRNHVKVKDFLKQPIRFQRFNLLDSLTVREPFDCIFCRNVMIYFDKKTQARLVNGFYEYLAKGGVFFIGHSESLAGIPHRFQYVRPAIYKKE